MKFYQDKDFKKQMNIKKTILESFEKNPCDVMISQGFIVWISI